MISVARLAQDLFGTSTVASGLVCLPPTGTGFTVSVNPGALYSMAAVDSTAYGSLAPDTAHTILKQGILLDPIFFTCPPPSGVGTSVNYLIEAQYQDSDIVSQVLPYYNAVSPSSPLNGPGGAGTAQVTQRDGAINLVCKAGAAAATGSQVTPTADAGFVGLWVVTVGNGQTTILAGNIAPATNAPFFNGFLSAALAFTQAQADARYLPQLSPTAAEIAVDATIVVPTAKEMDPTRYGADPTGATNSTAAFATAYAVAKHYALGGKISVPRGSFVADLDHSSTTAVFSQSIIFEGQGRYATSITAATAGGVVLNVIGTNQNFYSNFTINAHAAGSQCGILLARTTGSQNCAYHTFQNIYLEGSYTKACRVSIAAETLTWINCRGANTSGTNNHCDLWTGGGPGAAAAINVTGLSQTLFDSSNTANTMLADESYAPFNGATPRFYWGSAEYSNFGTKIICGATNNCLLNTYVAVAGIFQGPVTYHNPHFEANGTGDVLHWMNGGGTLAQFQGIHSLAGYAEINSNTALYDYDRTNVLEQPFLAASTHTTMQTPNGTTGINAYFAGMALCSFTQKDQIDSVNHALEFTLILSSFLQESTVDVPNLIAGAAAFSGCAHQSVWTAKPTTGTFTLGENLINQVPTVGQPLGWRCTVSGTLGTLSGVTGSMTNGSNVLTVNSATGLSEGQAITVAGVTPATPFRIRKLTGTTAYLDANANATVSGAAVAFSAGTLTALANL